MLTAAIEKLGVDRISKILVSSEILIHDLLGVMYLLSVVLAHH